MITQLTSQWDAGSMALLIPIIAIFMGGLIAVASIMSAHQRKMAEMVRKNREEPGLVEELRAMRGELADLRDRVNHQTLAIEDRSATPARQAAQPPDVPERPSE